MICIALMLESTGFGQVFWDGGGGNNRWGNSTNWRPNTVPGAASNVVFDNTYVGTLPSTIELRGNRLANSLTFDTGDPLSIVNGTGTRTLTLTSGDITRTAGSSGSQGLTFTTLALGGNSVMDINGSGAFTIASDITGSGTTLTKTGSGELILSGANTFSGDTTVSAGTLTLQSASALGSGSTLTLAGGTLKLDTASTTVTTLNITGNSTIDFSAAATLNVTTLTISAGVTLAITNWTAASDFFFATNWTGATYDTMGSAPMNLITFSGFTANQTGWDSFDNQIRPNVPESATYGALLVGALLGLFAWRRRPA